MNPAKPAPRLARKVRIGRVISNRMQKTIVVAVDRLVRHTFYKRVVRRSTRFKVHDETNSAQVGDWVKIMETRPLSKEKRWRLVAVLRHGPAPSLAVQDPIAAQAETPPGTVGEQR